MMKFSVCAERFFFFSSRRRHTRCSRDWSSDVCSSDLRTPGIDSSSSMPPSWVAIVSTASREITWNLSADALQRSEEHTSELQSRLHLVCRLLLEKKKKRQ